MIPMETLTMEGWNHILYDLYVCFQIITLYIITMVRESLHSTFQFFSQEPHFYYLEKCFKQIKTKWGIKMLFDKIINT